MIVHEYDAAQALALVLRKLDAADVDLAAQVRAAIDAGKDTEEEEPRRQGRKKVRTYRKSVRLSEEEALAAAIDVLQAYFVEQPLFVSSAMDNARAAAVGEPRERFGARTQNTHGSETGSDAEKELEVELRAETQLTGGGDETYRLRRASESQVAQQRENVARLRRLLRFGE